MALGNNQFGANSAYIVPNRAKKMRMEFYKRSLLPQITNTDYEKEFKEKGDSVTIPRRPVITIGSYSRGDTFTHPLVAAQDAVTMTIDQGGKFEYSIERLDEIQAYLNGLEGEYLDDAVNRMRMAVESQVINAAPAEVSAYNKGKTAGKVTQAIDLGTILAPVHITGKEDYTDPNTTVEFVNAADKLADFITILEEQDIDTSSEQVWAVVHPLYANKVAKTAVKDASVTGDGTGGIRGGPNYIGKVMGVHVYQSNYITPVTTGGETQNVTVYPALFGISKAWSFAMQMNYFWQGMLQDRAALGVHGVQVWGSKVVVPEGLGVMYWTPANKR